MLEIIIVILSILVIGLIYLIVRITNNHYIELNDEFQKQIELFNYIKELKFILETIKNSSILYDDELIQSLHKNVILVQNFLQEKYFYKKS